MADIEKVIKDLEECLTASCRGYKPKTYCPHSDEEWDIMRDALELLKEQKAEIDRLKAEKNRVIEQIENEINILHKESRNVKDEVGTATYEWLINGFQASLDMIKDGEQE